MTNYDFTLLVDRNPVPLSEALFEVAEGELVPEGGGDGSNVVHATHDAEALAEALAWAVHAVESVGLTVLGVESFDLVSVRDIANRTGRSYESVRKLATGSRGPGGFPAPVSNGQWSLYSWTEVAAWLTEHYGTAAGSGYDRQLAAADHLIRARAILGEDRAGWATLVSA